MQRFRKILITVDFGASTHALLHYASKVVDMAQPDRIYFHHATEDVEIPEKVKLMFPDLDEPVTDLAIEQMKDLVTETFGPDPSAELVFVSDDGQPMASLLKLVREASIDLVIVGRPRRTTSESVLAEKLTRKAPCSVLIVPDDAEPTFERTVFASDFSAHSADAFDIARAFVTGAGFDTLEFLHVYKVPRGYHKLGKSRDQFAEIMRSNATESFDAFMEEFDTAGVDPHLHLILNDRRAEAIAGHVESVGADLLVMGARGRTESAAILLGSVAEKVLRQIDVPLLAVKRKGEGLDLLDVILKLGDPDTRHPS